MFEVKLFGSIQRSSLIPLALILSASSCFAEGSTDAKSEKPKPKATYTDAEKKIIMKDMEQASKKLLEQHYVHGEADRDKSMAQKLTNQSGLLLKQGKTAEGIAMLTKAIAACDTPEEKALYKTKDMPNFVKAQIYNVRGICRARLKQWPEAEKDFTEAIKLCPDYSASYRYRAGVYTAQNKTAQAANDTAKLSALPSVPGFLMKSMTHKSIDTSASDAIFNRKVREFGDASSAKYYVGGSKGRLSSKMENLCIDGRTLMDANKYVPAIEKFTAAIIASEDPKVKELYKSKDMYNYKLSWSYDHRAYCQLMLKNWTKAVSDLNEAIRLRPNYLESYINRGKAYKQLGKQKEAAADFAMSKILKPDSLPKFLHNEE